MESALGMKLYGEEKMFLRRKHFWAWTLSGSYYVVSSLEIMGEVVEYQPASIFTPACNFMTLKYY